MSTIPSEKSFKLSKVKLDPKVGLIANYQITQVDGGEPLIIDRQEQSNREIHPDLKNAFAALASIIGRVFGFTDHLTGEWEEEVLAKIEPRGVAWSGSGDKEGVVITAVFETANGTKTCINTPRIKLGQDSYGFEDEIEAVVNVICREVYAYLFEGKQAQLLLFGQPATGEELVEEEAALMEAENL